MVYFTKQMLAHHDVRLEGKSAVISGSGNVALFCAEKLLDEGVKVLALSDSSGFIHDPDGIDREKLHWIRELKFVKRGRISEYVDRYPSAEFFPDQRPWVVKADLAFPCATQNELNGEEAQTLIDNGCFAVGEGANMPCTPEAIELFEKNKVLFAPGKASNAGGVAVSALEMSQNSQRLQWTFEETDLKLQNIMARIHKNVYEASCKYSTEGNLVDGANIAGFLKVANAMKAHGLT